MKRSWRTALVVALFSCVVAGSARATWTGVTFFGDSLSDTGNILALTTLLAPPPFPNFPAAPGRFSNGPVWPEYLAAGLGFSAASAPSHLIFDGSGVVPIGALGGQNFSFGGARTALGGSAGATTGLLGQLIAWNGAPFGGALTRAADPNGLYVIAGGMNDVRDFRSGVPGAASPLQAATNLVSIVALLAQAGAEHFLVPNSADLGKIPEASALGLVAQSTAATLAFNAALFAGLQTLDATFLAFTGIDLDIRLMDVFGLFNSVYDDTVNHGGAVYGLTNATSPCIAPFAPGAYFFPGSTDVNCATSLFSDPLHPSAAVHRLLGDIALVAAGNTVPEPSVLSLLAIALVSFYAAVRRPRAASRLRTGVARKR